MDDPIDEIRKSMQAASETIELFRQSAVLINKMAEDHYLKFHSRLPGSLRTCRLRKKRSKRVWDFYENSPVIWS